MVTAKFSAFSDDFFLRPKIKNILADPQAGFYLIDKPKDVHSFQAVRDLRRALKIKKVGFAGTLDPLASGLLILATGRATRLLDLFHRWPKIYQARIIFGQTSDTYDLAGEIRQQSEARSFNREILEQNLDKFIGPQQQQAPIYSAKKVAGHKLHELARRGQIVVAPISKIEIYQLVIKEFVWPTLDLEIKCSAGTYIRSLAHDLGQAMGTGALLGDLRRTAIGNFKVGQALPLSKIGQLNLIEHRLSPAGLIKLWSR